MEFVMFRVDSWIVLVVEKVAIHESTRGELPPQLAFFCVRGFAVCLSDECIRGDSSQSRLSGLTLRFGFPKSRLGASRGRLGYLPVATKITLNDIHKDV
jgi:hypothetical protein